MVRPLWSGLLSGRKAKVWSDLTRSHSRVQTHQSRETDFSKARRVETVIPCRRAPPGPTGWVPSWSLHGPTRCCIMALSAIYLETSWRIDLHRIVVATARASSHYMARAWMYHAMLSSGKTTPKRFEPLRAEPNGYLVHHLSHSVTVSLLARDSEPVHIIAAQHNN